MATMISKISELNYDLFKGFVDGLSETYTAENDSDNTYRNIMVIGALKDFIGCKNYIQTIDLQEMVAGYLEEGKDFQDRYSQFITLYPDIKIDVFGTGKF